jgi:hypothetical protein
MESWRNGVMIERHGVLVRWNSGVKKGFPSRLPFTTAVCSCFNTPGLQRSITPILSDNYITLTTDLKTPLLWVIGP